MSGVKHLADEVAEKLGIRDPNDPRVEAEVTRLLSADRRAEAIACRRYGRPFQELPPHEQMTVWLEAEHQEASE